MRTSLPSDKIDLFKKLAAAGVSPQRMSVRLRMRVPTLRRLAQELGVALVNRSQLRKMYGLSPHWNSERNYPQN
jgi:hypothetical protein